MSLTFDQENPFAQPEALFQLVFVNAAKNADIIESVFDDTMLASNVLPGPDGTRLHIFLAEYNAEDVERRITIIRDVHGLELANPAIEPVEKKDWVAEVQKDFVPLHVGQFYVHNAFYASAIPADVHAIEIDAGAAFGTGHHATTSGCLRMIDTLYGKGIQPQQMLDMGCGTALLAIAMAKCWNAKVMASDIDAVAVNVASSNVSINGMDAHITCVTADGYNDANIAASAPYNIIISNILAHPLIAMAEDLAGHLAQGGYAILSGFREDSVESVCNAHQARGLAVIDQHIDDGWCCVLMKKE